MVFARFREVRYALILLAAVAWVPEARAGACGAMMRVEAAGPDLTRDGLVLLDTWQVDVVAPALDKAVLVTADGTRVAMKVVKRAGDAYRLQVLLAPQSELPANTKVHLAFGLPTLDKELAEYALTTSDAATAEVHWKKAPVALRRMKVPSNKGDTIDAYRVRLALDAPAFVLAEVTYKDKTSGSAIYVAGDEILVGLNGCQSILRSRTGAVTFTAIGGNGEVAAPGKPLRLRY